MDQADLEQTLNTSIEEQAFSGVISIRQEDHVLYARAAGYADRSNKIENSLVWNDNYVDRLTITNPVQ
ncbi:MAG: hypothetical protein LH702_06595 [Phormidesmis sp. CAN_BIN44]|nr:hypothetical protein [Phormidesmis sp. CAN_BIN44]